MPKEIRAVCYARVSSKEQAEKELSIPAQLEAMRFNSLTIRLRNKTSNLICWS
ncbi:hypothetical protein [Clostridium sp.]|uniref:hypothetical protein n=1 Tax=Clostridium sp. TaxID=1506 RepID=UPI002845D6FC|nr:hypothetical protein [Clostridium sp.]MDR3595065.1 hypothetical protein [Clostridium sp.]